MATPEDRCPFLPRAMKHVAVRTLEEGQEEPPAYKVHGEVGEGDAGQLGDAAEDEVEPGVAGEGGQAEGDAVVAHRHARPLEGHHCYPIVCANKEFGIIKQRLRLPPKYNRNKWNGGTKTNVRNYLLIYACCFE